MNNLIARIITWFKSLFGGGETAAPTRRPASGQSVMPRELIARVLEECDRNAMEYSDTKRQLPCTFSVFLSEEDFGFFYASNRDEVEGEIVDNLRQYSQQTGDLMKVPTVTLRVDTSLSKGEFRVETSFDAAQVPPTPEFGHTQPVAAEQMASMAREGRQAQSAAGGTPALEDDRPVSVSSATPPLVVTPAAEVIAADGTAYPVADQTVVGILRRADRELPDIVLKTTDDLTYCSQRHGMFLLCDDDSFAYQDLSNNGTVLMRGETSLRLGPDDDPVVLATGDKLVLGTGNPALTFVMH